MKFFLKFFFKINTIRKINKINTCRLLKENAKNIYDFDCIFNYIILTFKETQSNLSQVSIECIDKVIQNALIFYAR